MKAYFFKVGNQPAWLFNVNVDGLCVGDGINTYTLHKQAEHHAKLLAFRYGMPVKFWPQFKPENTVVVEYETNGADLTRLRHPLLLILFLFIIEFAIIKS